MLFLLIENVFCLRKNFHDVVEKQKDTFFFNALLNALFSDLETNHIFPCKKSLGVFVFTS
jgi:hypothetical protein